MYFSTVIQLLAINRKYNTNAYIKKTKRKRKTLSNNFSVSLDHPIDEQAEPIGHW